MARYCTHSTDLGKNKISTHLSGYKYGQERDEDYTPSLLFPTISDKGCQTACLWSLPGFFLMAVDRLGGDEHAKVATDFRTEDTVCALMIQRKDKFKLLSKA